ncbi:hypothetical protein [Puerhibacterium puerhi]|uniref:hypothetical protein n=1 Tax=Puerhibacterium puerhi TaxID=2692623 RepID=UPI001358DAD2|nr:hypothetical protein [Puerhibacterium puerhi]
MTAACEYVVFKGSPNPDSPAFGPDEKCGEPADPGSDFCTRHAWVDEYAEDFIAAREDIWPEFYEENCE